MYSNEPIDLETERLRLVLYDRAIGLSDPGPQSASFWFDIHRRSVIAPARKMSDHWLCSRMLHEFFHAEKFFERAPSSLADEGTDLWMGEEVEAHLLEIRVLDQFTGGRYSKRLDEVLAAHPTLSGTALYWSLSVGDLTSLDSLFEPGTQDEMRTRGMAYIIHLGLRRAIATGGDQAALTKAYDDARNFSDQ